jgi:hypothetical protein
LNSLPLLSRLYAHPQIESSKSFGLAGVRIVKAKERSEGVSLVRKWYDDDDNYVL